ncbi:ABC transporter substrate-binding protein (plasmid) [Methylocystis sp. MJC1]|jgi:nitrate/nitrite transport system substrate-binding protein|uniref:CmpA/NrtA family ABC transporter substrate-binding protein n=1 Tax=Methylocystis sp. MJC1 TaxID=2654282 RepID=UPI0013EE326D|nr:CmpA/NrtA family ABC transporter substrate-binding protein [Methylocystis sp. MJC1]KAF2989085.1 Nitrate transport protein NrtA [Methylocystis sp. MJC1]MBU6529136.1 ABC transporter substrate-binding protein [Methylocystis sp. MJC1]UZX14069.1 ABC transporter substrate-binding protein [Methylocystis sp. MJC1]
MSNTPGNSNPAPMRLDRRSILKGAAASLVASAVDLPSGVFAEGAGPETTKAILGYIALTDSAPLIIAKEKGLFAKYGMPDVEVVKQASWGASRDNTVLGGANNGIDGAHILTPMPYLISTGKVTQNNAPTPMYILARLNLDCQGISVSNEYKDFKAGVKADALKAVFAKKKAEGKEIKVAVTFPGGTHDLWMRYWLAASGIDPDKDVSTIVVPPPQMVANMKVGNMDAFCVGEPWNEQLVNQGVGYTACTTGELWFKHPEKSLGMRAEWVDKNPKAAKALVAAVIEAQQWCDKPENKAELAEIVGRRQWFNVPATDIIGRLKGDINYGNGRSAKGTKFGMKFWRDNASYPFKSHDAWFVTEDIRWNKLDAKTDIKAVVDKVNREDLWREAAKIAGVSAKDIPTSTSRGKETFFDGKVFDPDKPLDYLKSQSIKRAAV